MGSRCCVLGQLLQSMAVKSRRALFVIVVSFVVAVVIIVVAVVAVVVDLLLLLRVIFSFAQVLLLARGKEE